MNIETTTRARKITVVGSGYVGMSLAVLLGKKNSVKILDVDRARVDRINSGRSTVVDQEIEDALADDDISIQATTNKMEAYRDAEFVIVATPTDYDEVTDEFDTSSVDEVVGDAVSLSSNALVVIKSTLPIGHTSKLRKQFSSDQVIFSPEFLREGRALFDNLNPSRIIVGSLCERGAEFASLLSLSAESSGVNVLLMESDEAESVKLFSNAYLAMRVAFFNELDTYAMARGLDTRSVINGMCADSRIGQGYNNPSFGYGGYCLPKDTRQLLSNFKNIPQTLMRAIVSSNSTRKKVIVNEILALKPHTVGFYRLIMKSGSDNFRSAACLEIVGQMVNSGIAVIIYEPALNTRSYKGGTIINDLEKFKDAADVIVANRLTDEIRDISEKCFSRDLFSTD